MSQNPLLDLKVLKRLEEIDTFLLDLDGTFYLGDQIFPWSQRFITRLKELDKHFIFVTNNSSRSAKYYLAKLAKMGVCIDPDQVFTSGEATIYFLKKCGFGPEIFLLGTPDLEEEFRQAGFRLGGENPAAVVLGFDLTLTYEKLRLACDLIRRGIPFIATHPDLNCPTLKGPIPDCGAMIAAITAATGVKPKVIGKPFPEMVEALCAKLGLEHRMVAMIGDRLYTDIAMGQQAGILSVLVLSGETKRSDLEGTSFKPDLVVRDLGELADLL